MVSKTMLVIVLMSLGFAANQAFAKEGGEESMTCPAGAGSAECKPDKSPRSGKQSVSLLQQAGVVSKNPEAEEEEGEEEEEEVEEEEGDNVALLDNSEEQDEDQEEEEAGQEREEEGEEGGKGAGKGWKVKLGAKLKSMNKTSGQITKIIACLQECNKEKSKTCGIPKLGKGRGNAKTALAATLLDTSEEEDEAQEEEEAGLEEEEEGEEGGKGAGKRKAPPIWMRRLAKALKAKGLKGKAIHKMVLCKAKARKECRVTCGLAIPTTTTTTTTTITTARPTKPPTNFSLPTPTNTTNITMGR